jgi:hypothetical protein
MSVRGARTIRRVLAATLVAVVVMSSVGCQHGPGSTEEQASEATHEPAPGDGVRHLTLGVEEAERAGIRTAIAERAEGTTEIQAFGRVLDPLPLVEELHARSAVRAASTAARAEYERVARLHHDDQNASTRDLENARAMLEKTTLDLADAAARLTLGWGAAAEGDGLADDLVAGYVALIRVDLPAGVTVTPPPSTVTVAPAADPAGRRVARVLGRAPTTDPLVQGEGYLVLLADDPPRPGAVLSVTVPRAAPPAVGVAVPAAAVVWVDAQAVVYVAPAAGEFERRTVTLGPRLDGRWIVTAGVATGDRIVVAGAARLLSSAVMGAEPAD